MGSNSKRGDTRPESTCAEQDHVDAENAKLEIKHMAGAYLLSGILATLGILLSMTERAKKRRKAGACSCFERIGQFGRGGNTILVE